VPQVAVDASAQAEVLSWLREHGIKWNESICAEAAYAGDLDALIWAREQKYCTWRLEDVLEDATEGGT
jgi:hypothetical protein